MTWYSEKGAKSMGFISKAIRVAKVTLDEINKPETFVKGDNFEAYIRDYIFVKDKYNMIQRTHDYSTNKNDYVENTKEPDFKFRCIKTGKDFLLRRNIVLITTMIQ
ncbi:hypothetical protein ACFLYI_00690 [Chloroflexota bacterium]